MSPTVPSQHQHDKPAKSVEARATTYLAMTSLSRKNQSQYRLLAPASRTCHLDLRMGIVVRRFGEIFRIGAFGKRVHCFRSPPLGQSCSYHYCPINICEIKTLSFSGTGVGEKNLRYGAMNVAGGSISTGWNIA